MTCAPPCGLQVRDCSTRVIQCPLAGGATDCAQPGVTLATLPIGLNYWRVAPDSALVRPCYTAGVCIGSDAAQARKVNASSTPSNARLLQGASLLDSSSTFGDGLCRLGHTGPFCEQCAVNYHKDPSGLCNGCDAAGGSAGLTIAVSVALPLAAIVLVLIVVCCGRKKSIEAIATKLDEQPKKMGGKAQGKLSIDQAGDTEDPHDAVLRARQAKAAANEAMRTATETATVLIRGKIFLSFVQVITQLRAVFEISFPVFFSSVLRWIGLLQLDLFTFMPLGCLFATNFHTTLLLRTIIPLAVMLVIGLAGICILRKAEVSTNSRTKASHMWYGNLLITIDFVLLFLIYPSVCSAIFATFQCKTLDDGSSMLRIDLLIDCDSSAHQSMVVYAVLMVFVYALGAPLLYAYLLFKRFGKQLGKLKDIEARRETLADEAKAKDKYDRHSETADELAALASITVDSVEEELLALKAEEAALRAELPAYIRSLSGNGYAKRAFFFEIVECLRKLSIVCVPVIFETGSRHQLLYAMAITFLTFGAYSMIMPYAKLKDNYIALTAQAIIFFNLMSSVAQPLGAGMDAALCTLLFGFIALSIFLSMPSPKKLFATRAKTNGVAASSTHKTDNADLKA